MVKKILWQETYKFMERKVQGPCCSKMPPYYWNLMKAMDGKEIDNPRQCVDLLVGVSFVWNFSATEKIN